MARTIATGLASLGAVFLACFVAPVSAQEPLDRLVTFDIKAQPIEAALLEFSRQASVQVMMVGATAPSGFKTDGVKGKLAISDALRQLLRNTGLNYVAEGKNTIRIKSPTASSDARERPIAEAARLASRDAEGGLASSAKRANPEQSAPPTLETLDEIVVTGTHIRGVAPGPSVIAISALEIQQSGYAAMQDWIDTLPQNFGSVPNEETGGVGNFNKGTSINLRGLGAGATLVLVNGRRQPVSGTDGDFVDISSIPQAAIERVEVLTDGASALYGSDAIGGVVNVVLRKDYQGAETTVRYAGAVGGVSERVASQIFGFGWNSGHVLAGYQFYDRSALQFRDRAFAATPDKRSFGGDDFRSISSNPSNILDPETGAPAFAIPTGQNGVGLTSADLIPGVVNLQNDFEGADLLPKRTMHSVFLSASQRLGTRFEAFAEGRYSSRHFDEHSIAETALLTVPDSNPFFVDPFGGSASVDMTYNFIDDLGNPRADGRTRTWEGVAGITAEFSADWKATFSVAEGQERLNFALDTLDFLALDEALADPNPATAFNPFADGSNTSADTLATLRDVQREESRSQLRTFGFMADGPLFDLLAGPVKLAIGADYREEELQRGSETSLELKRNVTSGYAEAVIPLMNGHASESADRLSVSLAGRYERYSDFGSTFNPKIGLRFAPLQMLELHGSWGTSFRAPKLLDLESAARAAGNAAALFPLPDPASPTFRSLVLLRFGGNSALQEETADIWSLGLKLKPSDTLSIAATYYDIVYEDRVTRPGPLATATILFQEDIWHEIITRNPSRAEADAVCNDPNFSGSRATCLATTPAAIVDFRRRNIAATETNGIDLAITHSLRTGYGDFALNFNGTYVLNYRSAVSSSSPFVDFLDTVGNPIGLRARVTESWQYRNFAASLSVNYTDSYDDTGAPTPRSVASWTTLDLRSSYEVPEGRGVLSDTTFALTVANLLDEDPPFINSALGYDAFAAAPLGRFIGFQITKGW